MKALEQDALDQLFRTARTCSQWTDQPVDDSLVHELYDLLKSGPTSANSCPARFVWVRSAERKTQLATMVPEANKPKILSAPMIAIIGYDLGFPETLSKLLPADRVAPMQKMFSDPELAQVTALRNGSLQGAYLIMAARALGLDCGPMSGFDHKAVDEAFFAGTLVRSNFLCCLGFGEQPPFSRNPRLGFEQACRFA